MNKKYIAMIVVFAFSLGGCEYVGGKVVNYTVDSAKSAWQTLVDYKNNVSSSPVKETDPVVIIPAPVVVPVVPTAVVKCGGTATLMLCKTYSDTPALIADPNVKNFGFSVSVDNVVIHKGLQPALKYRTLSDGSIERG